MHTHTDFGAPRAACTRRAQGAAGDYSVLRDRVVAHLRANEEGLRWFVEDDEPYDKRVGRAEGGRWAWAAAAARGGQGEPNTRARLGCLFRRYCNRMARDGTWGGHLELNVASVVTQRNITVHQAGQPCWVIKNVAEEVRRRGGFKAAGGSCAQRGLWTRARSPHTPLPPPQAAPTIHVSYHDGMHFNSVRLADDFGSGPPQPIRLADLVAHAGGGAAQQEQQQQQWEARDVERAAAGSGCDSRARVEAALARCKGDADEVSGGRRTGAVCRWGGGGAEVGAGAETRRACVVRPGQAIELLIEEMAQQVEGEQAGNEQLQQQAGEQAEQSGDAPAAAPAPAQVEAPSSGQPAGGERVVLLVRPHPADDSSVLVALRVERADGNEGGDAASSGSSGGGGEDGEGVQGGVGSSPRGAAAASGAAPRRGKGVKLRGKQAAGVAGRNKPCPCGSRKKFKNCCGAARRTAATPPTEGDGAAAAATARLTELFL